MDDFFEEHAGVKRKFSATHKNFMKPTKEKDRIFYFKVPYKPCSVILMNHPASLTLYKYVSITVLSGTVSINGYEITKRQSIKVFSSEKTGLFEMKTETCENIWKKKTTSSKLESELINLFQSSDIPSRILHKLENSTVAVFIERCPLPCNVEFAELYYPQVFDFSLCKKSNSKDCYWLLSSEVSPLQFDEEKERLASEIAVLFKRSRLIEADFPKIIVCGPRNTGKSTLLRYLMNKMLSQFPHSYYYLDTDPGQPEFTPPGVVSITKVGQPTVLGPPFFNQDRKSKMIFTGDVSPSFIDMYCKSISTLMELYNTEYADHPLFVNTMGWMEGTGLQCLTNIITTVKPTVLIEIVPENEASMFDYRDYLPPDSQYFQISCNHQRDQRVLAPKIMRELSLLAHLGNTQRSFMEVKRINELQPYCVSWKNIPIFIFPEGNIQPSRMVEALNKSIVALCHVPEDSVLESNISEFPKTLVSDPENECLAYGLVRAIDEKDNLLYINSSLNIHELQKVNALIKGNVMVPDPLILQQDIYNVPLPYTNVNYESSSDDEDMLNMSMLSLKYLSETESPELKPNIRDLKLLPPVKNFRKPAEKRYHRKNTESFMRK